MAFPDDFVTPRLSAERLRPSHAGDIHRMHQDAEQMALLGGVRDADQTAEYMIRSLQHWDEHGFGVWILRDRETNELAGRVLLRRLLLDGVDEIELGYSFFSPFWGRGLAVEVAHACLEFARTNFGAANVVALTTPANVRSQRVLEKLGLSLDRHEVRDGHDMVIFRTAASPAN